MDKIILLQKLGGLRDWGPILGKSHSKFEDFIKINNDD